MIGEYLAPAQQLVLPPSIPRPVGGLRPGSEEATVKDALEAAQALLEAEYKSLAEIERLRGLLEYNMPAPDSQGLCQPSGAAVNVAAAGSATILSFTVDEASQAFIKKIGFHLEEAALFTSVSFTVKINGIAHPRFDRQVFAVSTYANPLNFGLRLRPKDVLVITANNADTSDAANAYAIITGWLDQAKR